MWTILAGDVVEIDALADEVNDGSLARAAKRAYADINRKSRKRGSDRP